MVTKRYGLDFPDHINEVSIELWCYRNNLTPERGGLGKFQHLKNAIQMLWPEKMSSGSRGYFWHKWSDRRVKAWTSSEFHEGDEDWQTWWGPSSSGKSTDAGLIILADWLSAASETTTIVCSTTKDMLEKRIFGEIIRYHGLYKDQLPGTYYRSKNAILFGDENSKNGIFGIAIQKGTAKQALGNLIGIHNRFNRLVVDEMQATLPVVMDATDNLSTGEEFKFLGMGNPESRLDLLGQYSEPVNGWDSVSADVTESWETKFGKTHFFDGLKSPAIKEPKRLYFLLNQKQIDDLAKRRGEDSPAFWSQRRGFVPPEGLTQTVLTESAISKYHCMDNPEWVSDYTMVGGLDPAYSSGGDRCVLRPAAIGMFTWGVLGIALLPPIVINLKLSTGQPMTYYITEQVKRHCVQLEITPENLAVDTTGVQGMLVDVLEKEWGKGILRVDFVGNATDLPASLEDPRPAKDVYKNRVSELWMNFSEFSRFDQIRGLDLETAKEFCLRQLMDKDLRWIWIEPKKIMKTRTGQSPDLSDATACVTAFARERMGIHPGATIRPQENREKDLEAIEYDLDGRDNLYLTDGFGG